MGKDWELSELLIGMHETEGVGWLTIQRIVASGAIEGANRRREKDWLEFALSTKQARNLAERLSDEKIEQAVARRQLAGISVLTALDPDYPEPLRHIGDAPWVLYGIGSLSMLARPALAIVGTRMATAYGKRIAEELAASCAAEGIAIVSGMARGIDTAAHVGALGKAGSTIAVLASPVDTPYPPENRGLYREIAENGLVLSESPLGTPLTKAHFYLRNRIIAGLCQGTLVVEAGEGSGALITAKHTLDSSRDLFIVPGPITSPRSTGALNLLRDGAKPVMNAGDILEEYERVLQEWRERTGELSDSACSKGLASEEKEGLTGEAAVLYEILLEEPRTIDDLSDRSGLALGRLHTLLLELQMQGRVHQLPGAVFAVV